MRRAYPWCIVLVVLAVAWGWYEGVRKSRRERAEWSARLESLTQEVARLKAQKEAADRRANQAEALQDMLQQQLAGVRAYLATRQTAAPPVAGAGSGSLAGLTGGTNNLLQALTSAMKDPGMRDLIQRQQRLVLGPMTDRLYRGLYDRLNLTPEARSQLKDLLLKKMSVGADLGIEALQGLGDPAKMKELGEKANAGREAVDKEIKQLLGTEGTAVFEQYEQTQSERFMAGPAFERMEEKGMGVSAQAQEQIYQAMAEERRQFKFTSPAGSGAAGGLNSSGLGTSGGENFQQMFTDEGIAAMERDQEQLHHRYLERTRTLLNADQFTEMESQLRQQRETVKLSMRLGRSFFGGATGSGTAGGGAPAGSEPPKP
jgi:hypothetical protein